MEYMTTIEASEKWKISSRRISKLCSEGRVEGAVLKGKTWLIPENNEKPKELKPSRRKQS